MKKSWILEILESWNLGSSEPWNLGTLGPWILEILEPWIFGTLPKQQQRPNGRCEPRGRCCFGARGPQRPIGRRHR